MSNDSSSSSYQDFELEQEQKLSGLGRLAARAEDLDAELHRLEKEFYRVIKGSSTAQTSFSTNNSNNSSSPQNTKMNADNKNNNVNNENRAGINSIIPIQVQNETKEAMRPYIGVGATGEINLVPKRNLGWATWNIFSNAITASKHSFISLFTFPIRNARETTAGAGGKMLAFCSGTIRGCTVSLAFLSLGFIVSPALHITFGLYNNIRGMRNAITSDRTYDVYSGSYRPVSVEDDHRNYAALYSLEQRILTRGSRDHKRQKMFSDLRAEKFPFFQLMKDRLGAIGGLGPKHDKAGDHSDDGGEKKSSSKKGSSIFGDSGNRADDNNYYRILQVSPSATEKQVKTAYGKLAKVFHPDIDPSPKARKEFDKITKAYRTLVDPQLRKAYDAGGASFADATAKNNQQQTNSSNKNTSSSSQQMGFDPSGQNVIMQGSPMEVFQRIFGGVPFEQLIVGPHYRSIWHMRAQGLCRVNLHNYEVVETLRMLRLATFLASILDVYAMSDEALGFFVLQELEKMGKDVEHIAAKVRPHVQSLRSNPSTSGGSSSGNNCNSNNNSNTSSSSARGINSNRRNNNNNNNSKNDPLFNSSSKKSSSSSTSSAAAAAKTTIIDEVANDPFLADGEKFPRLDSFHKRSKDFATRLSKCCFGKEMLNEVGTSYITNARRYLGEEKLWKPRYLVTKKTASGIGRLKRSITGTRDPQGDPTKILSSEDLANFFSIEFDNVICNLHMVTRFIAITAVKDQSVKNAVELALFPTFSSLTSVGGQSTQRADLDGSHAVCPKTLERIMSSSLSISERSKLFLIRPRGGTSNPFKEIVSILKALPEKERNQVRDGVAERVSKARCIALKDLGVVFVETGAPWADKSLEECVNHIRDYGVAHANNNMPLPF